MCDSERCDGVKDEWIRGLKKIGRRPIIEEVETTLVSDTFAETYWISQFRQWGFDLLNGVTDIGVSGSVRARLSLSKKGKPQSKEHLYNRGKALGKGVYQVYKKGLLLGSFYSLTDASRGTGVPDRTICRLANTGRMSRHGVTVKLIEK